MERAENIFETIKMISEENLDIRTITMGISLLDCIDADGHKARQKIYDKITTKAKDLIRVANEIEESLGIPIVNKRVTVTPIALIAQATEEEDYVEFAKTLDKAADTLGIDFIGGFSALVQKGYTKGDERLIRSIPKALSCTNKVCASVNVGSTKAGLNMDAVREMGEIVCQTAKLTADSHGFGCAKLVVFTNAVTDNPFMAGGFHGVEEPDCVIHVGISGPGVVKRALEKVKGEPFDVVSETIKKAAFKITRMGQLVGNLASQKLGVPFGIVDLALAPTPAAGDSVAYILQEMGLDRVGGHGTTAALAVLNDAVKKGGIMACHHVGGLSGSFIPVSEDIGMIEAVMEQTITLDKLEAMTAICSVGLDMVAVPGHTTPQQIAGMIADESAIGIMNHKTTAVRIIPAIGLDVGDTVEFGGLLGRAPIIGVNPVDNHLFVERGGRIPAPLHSFKN